MQTQLFKIWTHLKTTHLTFKDYESFSINAQRREEKEKRIQEIEHRLQLIPIRFQDKSFGDFRVIGKKQILIRQSAKRFVETFSEGDQKGKNLLFIGKPGTGKTMLSLIIYQALTKKGIHCHYEASLSALQLDNCQYLEQLDFFKKPELLILDEVTEGSGEWESLTGLEQKILFELIHARQKEGRSTLLITSKNTRAMAVRLGKTLIRFINTNTTPLVFDWKSFRQKISSSIKEQCENE